jgi:PAS domain S-box-containing protein
MSFTTLKIKNLLKTTIAISLFIALLVSLLMIISTLQNPERFEHLYSTLLLINAVILLVLLGLLAFKLHDLIHQVRKKRAGARLTIRLVTLLVVLSTTPVIVVYYFSLEFLHQRLDNWFDVNIEDALTNALDLSRTSIDLRMREELKKTTAVAEAITYLGDERVFLQLNNLRQNLGALELSLLSSNGRIIAFSSINIGQLLPHRPTESVLLQVKQFNSSVNLESLTKDQDLHISVVVKLSQRQPVRLLHALFPIPTRIRELAENIEVAFTNYKERAYLQQSLSLTLTLVLSLILLLSIFSAVWMAFFAARRFVAPLSDLAEGTRAVAKGNYEKKLPVKHLDELGFLVQSFNEMTSKIAQARDEAKRSQQIADSQHAYLETVLECLSSGVISIDSELRLRTANPAVAEILGLPLNKLLGKSLTQLEKDYAILVPLSTSIRHYLKNSTKTWHKEMTLYGVSGRKILMCHGTQLRGTFPESYVIVCDDVTALIQAQRDTAWSEVARRLAHEIKNPLTPIQLSAERLRQKYLPQLSEKQAETLNRMTHTIIQQVDVMKKMVNAFSEYAKTPELDQKPLNINQLITEVIDLYDIPIKTVLDKNVPILNADHGRLRQVLHNLIKNALEAQPIDNYITISSNYFKNTDCIELRISDKGPGIPKDLLDKIFEPYVTTKTKGTGLGLAIVKKIIEEHNGKVWIEQTQGTCIVIRLPVLGSCSK